MSRTDFADALERQLSLRGLTLPRAKLSAFVDAVWPEAAQDHDPYGWVQPLVEEYVEEWEATA